MASGKCSVVWGQRGRSGDCWGPPDISCQYLYAPLLESPHTIVPKSDTSPPHLCSPSRYLPPGIPHTPPLLHSRLIIVTPLLYRDWELHPCTVHHPQGLLRDMQAERLFRTSLHDCCLCSLDQLWFNGVLDDESESGWRHSRRVEDVHWWKFEKGHTALGQFSSAEAEGLPSMELVPPRSRWRRVVAPDGAFARRSAPPGSPVLRNSYGGMFDRLLVSSSP